MLLKFTDFYDNVTVVVILTVRGILVRRKSPCFRSAHVDRSSLWVLFAAFRWERILSTGSIATPPCFPLPRFPPLAAALLKHQNKSDCLVFSCGYISSLCSWVWYIANDKYYCFLKFGVECGLHRHHRTRYHVIFCLLLSCAAPRFSGLGRNACL